MENKFEKKEIVVQVFHKIDYGKPIPFSLIKDIVQDDDMIYAGYDEGFYTENNSHDAHYFMRIERKRIETDEEFQKRIEKHKEFIEDSKKRRYENYLKLKQEFENQ